MSPAADAASTVTQRAMAADSAPPIRLAVDLMGGDHGPAVTLPACRAFLAAHPAAELVLVGRDDAIAQAAGWPRCTRVAASEVVEMTDSVETALRRKKDSSLRVAVSQVKPHADRASLAQACVSAGNTGALMAVSRYVLKTVDGIDRPAIATVMPNEHDGFTTVLDLGANVDCTAEHLLQFAVMGSALVAAVVGQGRADGRPAQHRRGSDQGQRVDQGRGRAAARGGVGGLRQLPRQRRGERHLQGNDRHRRLRRLRRQRDAEDRRRAGVDADDLHQAGVHANAADPARRARRAAGAEPLQAPRRPAPLQRRRAARPARPGLQEPRLGRRVRLRAGAQPRL